MPAAQTAMEKKKRSFAMPHVFVILTIIMLLVWAISFFVPSGNFERVLDPNSGREIVNPDVFNFVEKEYIMPDTFFQTFYNGIVGGISIMANLLICSGVLGFLESTGAFSAGIHKLVRATKGKELSLVVIMYVLFTVFGVLGYGEGAYPFYGLAVMVIMSAGYDRMTGAATVILGSCGSFACGMLNMFTTGISQEMVGLPLFSGIGYRFVVFVVLYAIGLIALFLYAARIKKDPSKSYVAEEYKQQLAAKSTADVDSGEDLVFNTKRKIGLILFLCVLVTQAVGALNFGWGLAEIASLYIMYSIVLAIIFRINPTEYSQTFVKGASTVLGASLVIGLGRSIMVLLTQGKVMDTIVYYMGTTLDGKSPLITLLLLYLFVTAFNFLVVSGSGKAVIMVPIMSPLGQMLGINQQVMILTYQLGDGLTNNLWPGGGAVGCSLCNLDYAVWFKYSWKVFGAMIAAGYVLIVIADLINYGPF